MSAAQVLVMPTPAAAPATWIRFAGDGRLHAVYAEARGGYFTFCSRFAREEGLLGVWRPGGEHVIPRGAIRCRCCKSRVKLPYLVPAVLERIRAEVARP
jgi:hypothetical protein